jgi:hypothetical protein
MTVLIDLGLVRLFCALLCVINLAGAHACVLRFEAVSVAMVMCELAPASRFPAAFVNQ